MSGIRSIQSSPSTHDLRRRWLGTRAYWFFQGIGWGSVFLVGLVPLIFDRATVGEVWRAQALFQLIYAGTGLGLSHLLRVVMLRYLSEAQDWTRFLIRLLPWCVALAAIWSTIILQSTITLIALFPEVPIARTPQAWLYEIVSLMTIDLPLMVIWAGFYLGIRTYRQMQADLVERAQIKAALQENELRTLKAQLDPHFLFNSLNSLRALISESDVQARETVTRLADLLRSTLEASRLSAVKLAEEWTTTENYLRIEQLRRGNRLRWRSRIEAAALTCWLPPLILQGLVENALKHGVDKREEGGELQIEGERKGEVLSLRVIGPGRLERTEPNQGVGLANSRARLRLIFGEGASLQLHQSDPDSVTAEVCVPQNRERRMGVGS